MNVKGPVEFVENPSGKTTRENITRLLRSIESQVSEGKVNAIVCLMLGKEGHVSWGTTTTMGQFEQIVKQFPAVAAMILRTAGEGQALRDRKRGGES